MAGTANGEKPASRLEGSRLVATTAPAAAMTAAAIARSTRRRRRDVAPTSEATAIPSQRGVNESLWRP
jgi:hypothetical protein